MKKLWAFLINPPRWYRNLSFWLCLALVPINLLMVVYVRTIPETWEIQKAFILRAFLAASGALAIWFLMETPKPK